MKAHQTRNTRKNKFPSPFADTYPDTYAQTYSDTYTSTFAQTSQVIIPPDIFDPENLYKTIWHVHVQAESAFYGLSADDMEIVDALLDDIQFQAETISPGQNEYTASQDDGSITITKATDPLSIDDYHLSYNKVTITVNNITIEWYFNLTGDDVDVEGDYLKNVRKDQAKPEVLYEKSESNKVEGYNRNNTGYKFWWSDGRVMDHGDVENFINKKRATGDKRFLNDFPVVKEGELAPSYTIVGRKQPYYAYDKRLKDPYEDGDNLQSTLLSGNYDLEQAYDGHIAIGTVSKGDSVNSIKSALNKIYEKEEGFIPLVENGIYDKKTIILVKRFQAENTLNQNGNVGTETLHVLDSKLIEIENAAAKAEEADRIKKEEEERKAKEEYLLDHPAPMTPEYQKDVEARMQNTKVLAMLTALSTVGNDLYGERYHPEEILKLTEKEKQEIFKTDSDKTVAILMMEFVEGSGMEIRDFGPETPISERIKYSYTTSLFLQYFVGAYKQGLFDDDSMSYMQPITIFTSPDNADQNPPGLPGSNEIAIKAFGQGLWNAPAFYTGSLDYFFTISGNQLNVVVHNEYSIASGSTRDERDNLFRDPDHLSPLGNTKQLFRFSFDISKLKK